jgi:hypothetical protein
MRDRRLGQVDLSTGEVLEGVVAYVAPRKVNGFGKDWLAMSQAALQELARQGKTLGLDGYRVLFSLLARLDFENLILLSQAEIARELSMHRAHVQRAIKRLVSIDAIIEGPRVGIHRSYRLNPEFGWKGSGKTHVVALGEYRQKRLSQASKGEGLSSDEPSSDSE